MLESVTECGDYLPQWDEQNSEQRFDPKSFFENDSHLILVPSFIANLAQLFVLAFTELNRLHILLLHFIPCQPQTAYTLFQLT